MDRQSTTRGQYLDTALLDAQGSMTVSSGIMWYRDRERERGREGGEGGRLGQRERQVREREEGERPEGGREGDGVKQR